MSSVRRHYYTPVGGTSSFGYRSHGFDADEWRLRRCRKRLESMDFESAVTRARERNLSRWNEVTSYSRDISAPPVLSSSSSCSTSAARMMRRRLMQLQSDRRSLESVAKPLLHRRHPEFLSLEKMEEIKAEHIQVSRKFCAVDDDAPHPPVVEKDEEESEEGDESEYTYYTESSEGEEDDAQDNKENIAFQSDTGLEKKNDAPAQQAKINLTALSVAPKMPPLAKHSKPDDLGWLDSLTKDKIMTESMRWALDKWLAQVAKFEGGDPMSGIKQGKLLGSTVLVGTRYIVLSN